MPVGCDILAFSKLLLTMKGGLPTRPSNNLLHVSQRGEEKRMTTPEPMLTPHAPPVESDHRLDTMFEIARILAAEHDLDLMVERLLSCLIETLNAADAGMLMLYVPAEGVLTVKAAQGYDLETLRELRLAPSESITGKAFSTGQADLYPTREATMAAMATMTPANQAIFRAAATGISEPLSAVAIPLLANHTKVGVLVLENLRRPGSFLPADLEFLKSVGDLLALAIENVRLRDELESTRARTVRPTASKPR